MLWKIESAATGGLRVIPEIPDISPCLLEGRNGIGKTVAVQLIQLASGEVPSEYIARPERWESLRARLGNTILSVSGLANETSLVVEFSPMKWPTSPLGVDLECLGTAHINDQSATMSEIASLLRVDRISGNEDLAASIERHRLVLEGQLRAMGQVISRRNAAVTALLDDILPDLERLAPEDFSHQENSLRDHERAVRVARDRAAFVASNLEASIHLNELIRKRGAVEVDGQDLLAKRDAAAKKVRDLEALLAAAQTSADELARILRRQGGVAERLAEASKLVRSRTEREAGLARIVNEASRKLDVAGESGRISTAIEESRNRHEEIDGELRRLDLTGQLRGVIDNLATHLARADSSLDDQLLGDGFVPALTVSAAAKAIEARRRAIKDEPTPEQARRLAAERHQVHLRLTQLTALADQVSKLARARDLLITAKIEYSQSEKEAAVASKGVDASRQADAEVGRVQQELTNAHSELAQVSEILAAQGTLSRADSDSEIADLLRRLQIDEAEAPTIESRQRRDSLVADREVEVCQSQLAAVQRHEATLRGDLDELVERLEAQPWFNESIGGTLRLPNGQLDTNRYWTARKALLASLARTQQAADRIARLEGLCREFLKPRRDEAGTLDEQTRLFTPAFASLFSARILEALRSPSIRLRLFDGAEPIGLDAANRTLILRRSDNEIERRPLSSYSTGEQAFAFTQARILDLEGSTEPNRLLVLDEFGAFVSADRVPELAEFLASETVRERAGQVVVILPLQVDYEAEIENTRGDLRLRYEGRLGQIRLRDYCAVELT